MSKRSRRKQQRKTDATQRRAEQQVALGNPAPTPQPAAAVGLEGAGRPSIAALVLQRMDKLGGVLHQVDVAATPAQAGNGTAQKPSIKVTPAPSGNGMPTVLGPAPAPNVVVPSTEPYPSNWPACPKTCDPVEWRRALEAKEYYELKQIEDDGKRPWFQYPKHNYQYSEFVYCTPEMMQQMLEHMPINRPWKEAWSDAIARDVAHERWLQTHESIAINKLGNMHDGQHRAKGIIKAGRGWPIYITWNVPPEAIYVTDSGDKRKINEKLGLLFPDSKLTHKTAALCRSMMWGLSSRGIRYSESEIAEFAIKHHDVIVWVAKNLRGFRADLQAVIGKALLWWGEPLIRPFVERLKDVQFTGEGDPAKALYLWLAKAKQEGKRTAYANPLVYYRKTLAAVYAHVAAKDASKLYQKQDDIFEWLPAWEVPADSPCKGVVLVNPPTEEDQAAVADDAAASEDGEE